MKILFVLDLFKPHIGGIEVLFDNLIERLLQQGHSVKVLTSKYMPTLPAYEKISDTYEIYRVGHNRYDFMIFCLLQGIQLAKWADIIHTTTYNAAIPASIIGKISKKNVILTVHEIFGQLRYRFMGRKGFFYKCFESLIFLFPFDKFLCVSNYTKNNLRIYFGISDKKLITIYNGIDYTLWKREQFPEKEQKALRKEYGLEHNYLGLFFGRPGISKGLLYYVQALPLIIKELPHFKAVLIVSESKNNKADDIKAFIKQHHLSSHVIWIPGVPYTTLGTYILASDVVIVPSLVEGFGFSAAETCALGQQLVTTNAAALTEVVSGKVNFAEPAAPTSIAKGVLNFYQGKFETISERRFEREENVKKTIEVYETVLHKKKEKSL